MEEKFITFKRDESKRFYDLIETANRWIRFNMKTHSDFKHLRTVFDKKYPGENENVTDKLKARDIIKVYYTSISEVIDPEKCQHNNTADEIITPSTCSSIGSKNIICTKCGSVINTVNIPKLNHNYGEYVTIMQPTCRDVGIKRCICNNCGQVKDKEIPVIEHTFGEWELSVEPTLTSEGVKERVCSTCGQLESVMIPMFDGFKVTFNPNGGSCDISSVNILSGTTIGDLPIPENGDMIFGGWFTAPVDGLKVDSNYTINADVTLYARWGSDSGIEFGDATTSFNIKYNGDRTNYQDNPYTFYSRYSNGNESNLTFQTGISSQDRSNNMTSNNKEVKLYMKVTNNGVAGSFDIGFDCDSYIPGKNDDKVHIKRLENGVSLGDGAFNVTVPYETSIWTGKYDERTANRYNDVAIDSVTGEIDSGYAFTMNNIFINSGSYAILEVTFRIP